MTAAHGHGHGHGPLETIAHVHGGAPVIDIGGDIGAVVALMDPSTAGTELFLRADTGRRVHTGVWTRHQGAGHVTAAVFCELVEGTYWVLDAGGADTQSVQVTGGEVVEIDLRS